MRALKCHFNLASPSRHMLLTKGELEEAVARANARTSAKNFGLHIFRVISWMKELVPGRRVSDALIGAVGPSYINVLIPSPCANILELKVPVAALCGDICASDYDVTTQSIRLASGASPMEPGLAIRTWHFPSMVCTIARNCAQPIPHHAAANSVLVSEMIFEGKQGTTASFSFPVGHRMFPEMFSSCPDLTEWALMDRRLEKYSELWARVRTCQVHAGAVNSSLYTPSTRVHDPKWHAADATWYLQCKVEIALAEHQWLHDEDLAVLSCQQADRILELRGVICQARFTGKRKTYGEAVQAFSIEIKLSQACHGLRETHADFVMAGATLSVYFIAVARNEKKSIRMLKALPETLPLQGMPLTSTRTVMQQKRELEMRPLLTKAQVNLALDKPEYQVEGCKGLNDKQLLALKRGLQMPFTMVQGPPGTGKTSLLQQLIVAAVSAMPGRHGRQPKDRDRILVCAPSNQAADHLLDRLVRDTTIPAHYVTRVYSRSIEQENGSNYSSQNSRSERRFDIQNHLEEHALHYKVSQVLHPSSRQCQSTDQKALNRAYEMAEEKVLKQSYIVITTCGNSYLHTALSHGDGLRPVSFHTAVIDEAAQASEPDVVLAATLAAHRIVVVGDHQQLGPVVPERNLCSAYVMALETPFLERMVQNPRRLRLSTMLDVQYRMHPSIRSFPSTQFYESKLLDGVSMDFRPKLRCLWPQEKEHRLFIDCRSPQSKDRNPSAQSAQSMTSLKNSGEAEVVASVCKALLEQGCSGKDIAVLTPYTSQQHEICAQLESSVGRGRASSILVGTVHALQGSEREYIILSFVRSVSEDMQDITHSTEAFSKGDSAALRELRAQNIGIVSNRKLLNVALTRAKYGLVCIGNAEVLSSGSKDFLDLITSLDGCRCLVDRQGFLKRLRESRWPKSKSRGSPPTATALATIRPEDSASQVGLRSSPANDAGTECSVLSLSSSISVVSEAGRGPKCYLRGTLLPAASGMYVPVESIDTGTRIIAAGSSDLLQVADVHCHRDEFDLVDIQTESAWILVTSTHRIVMECGERRQASRVKERDLVQTSGGGASVTCVHRYSAYVDVFQVAFHPDQPVEAIWPSPHRVWTCGHLPTQAAPPGGKAYGKGRGDRHRPTRRSGQNRRPGFRNEPGTSSGGTRGGTSHTDSYQGDAVSVAETFDQFEAAGNPWVPPAGAQSGSVAD
ncbi:Regulator of nonsense transcripts 1-like [Symbiodinium microadriaticum]|uniref:Regulator of nonsense transcripts 1-like n=1 Tax=Symbiodinium microadriaticum TaxID=2951 RepID=A0A1Q9EF21_SYMMI|nr:Regulator of nonsense transcripts 1-like [Symbiodinium microadriaticum]